jgi:excisionase family DNA binding protein
MYLLLILLVLQAKLIGIVDAAQLLGVSSDSIRRLIKRGDIRHVRVAGRVLVPRTEVDRICAPQTEMANVGTTGQPPKELKSSS